MFKQPRSIVSNEMRQFILNHSTTDLNNAATGESLSLPRTNITTITKYFYNTGKRISNMKELVIGDLSYQLKVKNS